jgi:glycosyltransferase involved in cell wall biosynthesis
MENSPSISFITVTFQAGNLLSETMQSILDQSYTDYEYLIIDGGSKDNTLAIIQSFSPLFQEKGISMQWISEPDHGIYDAMNKGITLAKGNYLWFLNAGDRLADNQVLSTIITHCFPDPIRSQPETSWPDFIYGETQVTDNQGNILGNRRLKAPQNLTWKHFRKGMLVCHQSMLVKRSMAPFFDLSYRYSADFDWSIRCLQQAKCTCFVPRVFSLFMTGGTSTQQMKASLKERFHIMAHYYGWLPTTLHHIWFIARAGWFKLRHGWIYRLHKLHLLENGNPVFFLLTASPFLHRRGRFTS